MNEYFPLQTKPFSRIKIRFLLAWFLFGSVLFLSIPDIATLFIPGLATNETMFEIVSIIFYISAFLFCTETLQRNGILFSRILGTLPSSKTVFGPLALTIPVYFFSLFSLVFFASLIGLFFPFEPNVFLPEELDSLGHIHPLIAFIGTVIAAPIVEELLFRGILLHRWAEKWGFQKAFIITSLLFGVLHIQNALSITLFAFILGIIYVRTGSLYLSILCHMVYNLFSYIQERIASTPPESESIESLFSWDIVIVAGTLALLAGIVLMSYILRQWPKGLFPMPYEKNIS